METKSVVFVIIAVVVLAGLVYVFGFSGVMLAPQNVSVTVSGVDAVSFVVSEGTNGTFGAGILGDQGASKPIDFVVTMIDPNGEHELDDSSVSADFYFNGVVRETPAACIYIPAEDTTTSHNYSCVIDMWYFDEVGIWTVNVTGRDTGNGTWMYDTGTNFQYLPLNSIEFAEGTGNLDFGSIVPGATDVAETGNPTKINNTGNYEGALEVVGIDLRESIGQPVVYTFSVANFSVDDITDGCSGLALTDQSPAQVTASIARGNLSAGQGQTDIYYCIPSVPGNLPAQTYSTEQVTSWEVQI